MEAVLPIWPGSGGAGCRSRTTLVILAPEDSPSECQVRHVFPCVYKRPVWYCGSYGVQIIEVELWFHKASSRTFHKAPQGTGPGYFQYLLYLL